METEILITADEVSVRVARVADGVLTALEISPVETQDAMSGQIYLARVERVVEHLQAAFVDIGEERAGFLGAREARALLPDANRDTPIEDCVEAGDEILVQITRAAQAEKGAQITADVTLAGRVVVVAPCRRGIAISRAIEDDAERKRLADTVASILDKAGDEIAVEGMDGDAAWVIRTAAVGMSEDALAQDMRAVAQGWKDLLEQADTAQAPALLYEDLNPVERALRDMVRDDTSRVLVEGDAIHATARAYCARVAGLADDICHAAEPGAPLFERHDVEGQIETALAPRVALPSGGWLMFETTEAMTTIDVNSGSDTANAHAVNLEAAPIIARQIRLRGLGGLLAIDFIDTPNTDGEHQAVRDALAQGFEDDKQPTRIGDMSDFGVIEMTRRRPPNPLRESLRRIGR